MQVARIAAAGLSLLAASLACHASAEDRALSDQQWTDDLRQLATSIETVHFKPFHVLPEAEFDAAIEDLEAQIPELSDHEIIVRMAQIVARLGDGHTRLHIPRLYPHLALPAACWQKTNIE